PNVLNGEPGDRYRFNWNTPVVLSPHNPSIVWFGGNRLFKSYNRGDTWMASADLTKQVDRNKVSLMGAPGDRTQLSKNDGVTSYRNVQVIREDPKNRNLLYAGTEFGLFVSLDGGRQWQKFMGNYPTVRTDDILVHPRDNDLIVATHGRSVWIADDITPLQQWTAELQSEDAHLFDIRPAIAYLNDQQHGQHVGGQKVFVGENAPRGAAIHYYLKAAPADDVRITVADATGKVIRTLEGPTSVGISRVMWNLAPSPPPGDQGRGG